MNTPADPPAGYEWYTFDAGKGAYLRPDGWFVKVEADGDTDALFISKEDIDKKGSFTTGLTVNVVRGIQTKTGQVPSQYAAGYISALAEQHKLLETFPLPPSEGMTGFFARFRDASHRPIIMVVHLVIADDVTDTMRIEIFESPERDWPQAWVHGERMLKGRLWR